MENTEEWAMRDAAIISAAQKVEHYEIASYGTLQQFAETLGLDEVVDLLEQTLVDEKACDENLTELASRPSTWKRPGKSKFSSIQILRRDSRLCTGSENPERV